MPQPSKPRGRSDLNYFGVKLGGNVQIVVTVVKVALIFFIIIAGLVFGVAHAPALEAARPLRSELFRRKARGQRTDCRHRGESRAYLLYHHCWAGVRRSPCPSPRSRAAAPI